MPADERAEIIGALAVVDLVAAVVPGALPAEIETAAGCSINDIFERFGEPAFRDGERKIMIASLRYLDTFVKIDDTWLFAERNLILDWSETWPSTP